MKVNARFGIYLTAVNKRLPQFRNWIGHMESMESKKRLCNNGFKKSLLYFSCKCGQFLKLEPYSPRQKCCTYSQKINLPEEYEALFRFRKHKKPRNCYDRLIIIFCRHAENSLLRESFEARGIWNDQVILRLKDYICSLNLILLTWTIWRAPTNASKWRMGFNSAFKGLKLLLLKCHTLNLRCRKWTAQLLEFFYEGRSRSKVS